VEEVDAEPACAAQRAALDDADPAPTGGPLPLVRAGPDPLLAVVRRVPLLGGLLPVPQVVDWGEVVTYRVELRTTADEPCGAGACYEAMVLDAAP
jgi:hypothetical protein